MIDKSYFRPPGSAFSFAPESDKKSVQKSAHEVFNNPQHQRTCAYLEGQF